MKLELKVFKVKYKNHAADIPYYEIIGENDGPAMFISGGMHGNEIGGIAIVEKFLQWALEENIARKLSGKLTIFPLLNPSGFAHMTRRVHEDNKDLNRCFGLEEVTSFSEEVAAQLTDKFFRHHEFGIDCHDSGGRAVLTPHSRVHKNEADGCIREIGQIFGTDIILERKGSKNMMAIALNRLFNTKVLTVETGGAQKIFPEFVEVGLRGIKNILVAKKMYPGNIYLPDKQYLLHDRYGISIDASAKIIFNIKLGDVVHAGQKIGKLYYPEKQKHEEIIAPMCGVVFSLWQQNQVPDLNEGRKKSRIIYSILEVKNCHVKRTTEDKFIALPKIDVTKINM